MASAITDKIREKRNRVSPLFLSFHSCHNKSFCRCCWNRFQTISSASPNPRNNNKKPPIDKPLLPFNSKLPACRVSYRIWLVGSVSQWHKQNWRKTTVSSPVWIHTHASASVIASTRHTPTQTVAKTPVGTK